MTADVSDLLGRLSDTLRHEIGPALDEEYVKTQAFMASVILAKLSKQVALADDHADAERSAVADLHRSLEPLLADAPVDVTDALGEVAARGTVDSLGPVIRSLYGWGIEIEEATAALGLIRVALRGDIDRRMAIAT